MLCFSSMLLQENALRLYWSDYLFLPLRLILVAIVFAFFCCSLARFSAVSVVLTFNASLSARAPSSPILLPVWWYVVRVVLFAWSSLNRLCVHFSFRTVSVVLTFKTSLSARDPSAPTWLSVCRLCRCFDAILWFILVVDADLSSSMFAVLC